MATPENTVKKEEVQTVETKPGSNGAAPIEIKIDLDNLTIGDLETLDSAGRRELPMKDMIAFLERVVVGGVRHLPLSRMGAIIDALGEAIGEATNPGN